VECERIRNELKISVERFENEKADFNDSLAQKKAFVEDLQETIKMLESDSNFYLTVLLIL
jgi:predicted nuclease with TOPRIM domain